MDLTFPLHSFFIAMPLEGNAKWQYQAWQEELKPYENIMSFQNPQSPHLTLQFWETVMEIEYNQILPQSKKIASTASPFTIKITGADTFGKRGEDRVLFLNIAFSEELARLKKSCPWESDKEFSPHLTLARMRHPQKFAVHKKKIMKLFQDCSFEIPVDRLRLYADIEGRKQTVLQDFVFESQNLKT